LSHADEPHKVEILLAFDHDDPDSFDYFQDTVAPELTALGGRYTAYGFDRLGYLRLNEYLNQLAPHAQGGWFMFWGDDAVMHTQGWDSKILAVPDFRVIRMPTHNQHPYAIFPIVPREWFEIFGYLSPHQLTDTWLSQCAYMLDIMHTIDVEVTHDRFDITGNNNDETFQNRPMLEGRPDDPRDFNHYDWRLRRSKDCDRLSKILADRGQDMTWWERVKTGQQDAWAKMCSKEFDPNGQVSSKNV